MRPRASQVAKTRLVETEEDVETYRPVLDAIMTAIVAGGAGEAGGGASHRRRKGTPHLVRG